MSGTTPADEPKKPAGAAGSPLAEGLRDGLGQTVASNPAFLNWPQDRWGFTSELRKALLKAASGIQGDKEKHDLVMLTLGIGAKHVMTRFLVDKAYKQKQIDEILAAQEKRNR